MTEPAVVLTLSCRNRPGIVAAVSAHLFEHGCNILDAQQYDDTQTGNFFMRVVLNRLEGAAAPDGLREAFAPLAERSAAKL